MLHGDERTSVSQRAVSTAWDMEMCKHRHGQSFGVTSWNIAAQTQDRQELLQQECRNPGHEVCLWVPCVLPGRLLASRASLCLQQLQALALACCQLGTARTFLPAHLPEHFLRQGHAALTLLNLCCSLRTPVQYRWLRCAQVCVEELARHARSLAMLHSQHLACAYWTSF